MNNKEKLGIRILTVSALLLLVACIFAFLPGGARAENVVKDRDYILVTAPTVTGGDALYLTDARTGLMAVFVYDPSQRAVVPKAMRAVPDIFIGRP